MKRWLLRVSVVLCAMVVVAVGAWWMWREWWSAEQFRAAVAKGIKTGDFNWAERLKKWGADINSWHENDSGPQMMGAVVHGNTNVVRPLVSFGADVDMLEPAVSASLIQSSAQVLQWTPLHRAVFDVPAINDLAQLRGREILDLALLCQILVIRDDLRAAEDRGRVRSEGLLT